MAMDYRELKKEIIIVLVVIITALSFWSGAKYTQWKLANEPVEIYIEDEKENPQNFLEEEKIYIHVAGAVNNPGVYSLNKGARIEDVLKLAEPKLEADIDRYLNRAALLQDSDKIYVPYKDEIAGESNTDNTLPMASMSNINSKININRATAKELETLPGIGPTRAQAIIQYRNTNGAFRKIEDLMEVKGIGPAIFENIKDEISL
jgi:competence protein ComEA